MKNPKIALATEFLVQYGGAQKTLEAISELFPEAPIYTAKYIPDDISGYLNSKKIISPKNNWINNASKYFFTFLMAPVFEEMDFRNYDILISDGTTWTKGIITKPEQMHITYIHTPPRFLYGYSRESGKRDFLLFKLFFSYVDNLLRLWDYTAAQRPDYILTNSATTKARINKFYRRNAHIIYPPVELDHKPNKDLNNLKKPYYIAVGRLAKYKNFEVLINAFNLLNIDLVIVGTGSEEKRLKKLAGENISFVGQAPEELKHSLIEGALGLINPVVDEDFGIVPVEAMAHGTPVLGHRSGGHLETVIEGKTGMFIDDLSVESLVKTVRDFDNDVRANKYDKGYIKRSAERFSKERFQKEFYDFVMEKWQIHESNK